MSLLAQIYSALGSDTELGISVDGFTLAGPLVSGFGNRYQLHRCYFVYFYTAVSQRGQYHGSLTQIEDSDQNTGRETGYLTG